MPTPLTLFILWSTICVAGGWMLSALKQLNAAGYGAIFILTAVAWAWIARSRPGWTGGARVDRRDWNLSRLRRRFRRPLPLMFLVVAALMTIGGAVHAPNNYDSLTYRLPRMFHWCERNGWHWITTFNQRMNSWAVNFEWLTTPLYLFTRSDRLLFLTNVAGFLLTPGLIFSVFRAAGVSARVAWNWMWILPFGYCYVLEGASMGNDSIAGVYILASVYYALRAGQTGRGGLLALSVFSAALATGVKATNLPALLPMAGALWWGWRRCRVSWLGAVGVGLAGALISFLPMGALNQIYCGDWLGRGNSTSLDLQIKHTAAMALVGNTVHLTAQTFLPPVMPWGRGMENWLWAHMPSGWAAALRNGLPTFGFYLTELPQEERSGLGLGVGLVAAAALVYALRRRDRAWRPAPLALGIGTLAWAAAFYFVTKLGGDVAGRVMSPYYPLLILPLAALPNQEEAARSRGWRWLGCLAGVFAVIVVVLTPSRPLWPAERGLAFLAHRWPQSKGIQRGQEVFATYRVRNDLLGPFRRQIPDDERVIGVLEDLDDPDYALWRPFGRREVVAIVPPDFSTPPEVRWLVIKREQLERLQPAKLEDWVRQRGGTVVSEAVIEEKVNQGPQNWALARFPGGP